MRSDAVRKIFTFALLALALFAVWQARKWSIQASLMPLLIGIPTVLLLLVQLLRELTGRDAADADAAAPEKEALGLSALKGQESGAAPAEGQVGSASIICWILGFALGIWLLGFPLGMTFLTLLYLKGAAREAWLTSAGIAAAVWLGATLFFDCTMHIFFAEGQLFVWLGFSLNPFYAGVCQQFMGFFR